MIRLAARTLRHRKGGFTAAFLTMLLGATIVMACGGLLETGIRAAVPPRQLAGTDVVLAGDQRLEVPGVDYTYTVPLSERVRIDAGLVDIVAALPGVHQASGHVFDYPAPQGTIDAVGVVAEAGTSVDQLRERIDAELTEPAVTLVGDERGRAEAPQALVGAEGLIVLASLFGAWAIMIAVFGVASMLALSIQQRHRELALLRAVGSTPGQLRQLVLGETVILAVVATGLAIPPGRWLGALLLDQLSRTGVVTDGFAFRLGWIPSVVAIGSAVLAAVGGALVAGARAARTRPTEALADAGLPERRRIGLWRILLGLALLVGSTALVVVTMTVLRGPLASTTGSPAVILLAIALAVLSPVLTRPLAMLLQPLGALTGRSGRLAMRNVRAGVDRTAAVAMPVILLTGIAAGLPYMHSTGKQAVHQEFVDGLTADAVITVDGGVDDQLVDRVNALASVASASEHVRSSGFVEQPFDDPERWGGSDRWAGWTLAGTTPNGVETVASTSVAEGRVDDLRGAAVALGVRQAGELGVGVGDPITLRMGDKAVLEVEVVALLTADDDLLLLPADVLATHTTEGRVTEILVVGDGRINTERMIADLEELTAGEDGVTVADRETLAAEQAEEQDTEAFAIYTIVAMIVAYTAISVVNALASSIGGRRRELGLQRLVGSTRGQVLRMLAIEGVAVAVIGVLLGTISAISTVVPFSIARADTMYPTGSPLIYVAVASGALALCLLATLVPGWWATRQRPIDAAVVG